MFTKKWLGDMAERTIATFVVAFCAAALLSGENLFSLSAVHAAALAGVAAALSVVKAAVAVLATGNTNTISPASLTHIPPPPTSRHARSGFAAQAAAHDSAADEALVAFVHKHVAVALEARNIPALVDQAVVAEVHDRMDPEHLLPILERAAANVVRRLMPDQRPAVTGPTQESPSNLVSVTPVANVQHEVEPGNDDNEDADLPAEKPRLFVQQIHEQPVSGRRLGRHIEHDEQSRAFAVAARPATIKSVRHHRVVAPFDQGDIGSCTGNAMTGALCTAPFKHRFTEKRAVLLYEWATELDNVAGKYPPDDTGSTGLAVAKAAVKAGYIKRYEHAFDILSMLSALMAGPVIVGTNWYSSFDEPAGDNAVVTIADNAFVRGGHEWEVLGFEMAGDAPAPTDLFVACNSWGTEWGDGGYFRIAVQDMTRLLGENGDVTVPIPM